MKKTDNINVFRIIISSILFLLIQNTNSATGIKCENLDLILKNLTDNTADISRIKERIELNQALLEKIIKNEPRDQEEILRITKAISNDLSAFLESFGIKTEHIQHDILGDGTQSWILGMTDFINDNPTLKIYESLYQKHGVGAFAISPYMTASRKGFAAGFSPDSRSLLFGLNYILENPDALKRGYILLHEAHHAAVFNKLKRGVQYPFYLKFESHNPSEPVVKGESIYSMLFSGDEITAYSTHIKNALSQDHKELLRIFYKDEFWKVNSEIENRAIFLKSNYEKVKMFSDEIQDNLLEVLNLLDDSSKDLSSQVKFLKDFKLDKVKAEIKLENGKVITAWLLEAKDSSFSARNLEILKNYIVAARHEAHLRENKALTEVDDFLRESELDLIRSTNSYAKKTKLTSSNGIEIEGVLDALNPGIEGLAKKIVTWLKYLPERNLQNVELNPVGKNKFKISFYIDGTKKDMMIHSEQLSIYDKNRKEIGVEVSSFVIENQDELELFLDLNQFAKREGLLQNNPSAGIHNHVGIKDLIGENIQSVKDPRIVSLGKNFEKIEDELFDYFGTHPYRNSISGRLKESGYLEKNVGQAIALAKGGARTGDYTTIEMRFFNSIPDDFYLAEAMNFSNLFLKKYFDKNSGLKEWMENRDDISLVDLFNRIEMEYNPRITSYPVREFKFEETESYLNVFGKKWEKAFNFLLNHFRINSSNSKNLKASYGELFNYLQFLNEKFGIKPKQLKSELLLLLKEVEEIENKKNLDLGQKLNNKSFIELPGSLKKELIEIMLPDGIAKASDSDLYSILGENFSGVFKEYPFSDKELNRLFEYSINEGDFYSANNIILLRSADINNHILELQNLSGTNQREFYSSIINNENLSDAARKHLKKLLN